MSNGLALRVVLRVGRRRIEDGPSALFGHIDRVRHVRAKCPVDFGSPLDDDRFPKDHGDPRPGQRNQLAIPTGSTEWGPGGPSSAIAMFQSAASVLPISRSPAMGLPVPSEGRGTGVMPLAMSQPRMVAPARPGGTKARYGWGLRSAITAKASRFILCHVTAMNGPDGISPSKVIFPEPTAQRP